MSSLGAIPDPAEFNALVVRHRALLHRYVARRVDDPATREDVTQETFLRAFKCWGSMNDRAQLRGWLIGIARRVASEVRRAEKRRRQTFDAVPVEDVCDASGVDPEVLLCERQTQIQLQSAMASLTHERRQLLQLRVERELPYDEIATKMGWSNAKVKNEIHRARKQLRALLAIGMLVWFATLFPRPDVTMLNSAINVCTPALEPENVCYAVLETTAIEMCF